jgi:hypothetical protein
MRPKKVEAPLEKSQFGTFNQHTCMKTPTSRRLPIAIGRAGKEKRKE